ncbi:MAG: S41 family peptidase [Cyanobacteria bacterium P01_A01_bin.135]
MRKSLIPTLLACVLAFAAVCGLCIRPAIAYSEGHRLVSEVWRIVDRAYVDDSFNGQNWWLVRQRALRQDTPDPEAAYAVVREMLAGLGDPFTRFLEPDQYQSLQTNTSGELTGVGLQITQDDDGYLKVISPVEGSPADEAGILALDRILEIDDVSTQGLALDEAAKLMRGRTGTTVILTVDREAGPLDVEIVRDRITLNPVSTALRTDEGFSVGYLRLNQFNANATNELAKAIAELEAQGAMGYVLDLRNNPGGLLKAGIEIARLWLDEGTVVYTVNRYGIQDRIDADGSALTQLPLVVLVNQGTASASEILSGALQDNGRAQLVGKRTFGKGLIQSLFRLSDGSGLAVTVARYETPSHKDINKQGITPDRVVETSPLTRAELGTAADAQYEAAVELLAEQLKPSGEANKAIADAA